MAGVSRNAITQLESRRIRTKPSGGPELRTLLGVTRVLEMPLSHLLARVEEGFEEGIVQVRQ